jgi:AraC-like DNA-binding protein
MINPVIKEHFGLIAYDKSSLSTITDKLTPLFAIKEIRTPSMFEVLETSLGAVAYVMPSNSHKHLYNLQEIRLRSPEKPIYIFAGDISIPLLHQALRLGIRDVFMLPCNESDLTRLQQDLKELTNVACPNLPLDTGTHSLTNDAFLAQPLTDMFNIIEETYTTKPSLEQAASRIHLSPSRVSHMFKDICGIGYGQYILCRRLEASEFFLSQPNASITEITFKLGFSNPSHFCRSFKEHLGLTPTAFMRSEGTPELSCVYSRYLRLRMELLPQLIVDDIQLGNKNVS